MNEASDEVGADAQLARAVVTNDAVLQQAHLRVPQGVDGVRWHAAQHRIVQLEGEGAGRLAACPAQHSGRALFSEQLVATWEGPRRYQSRW
mgnify:CR=1 FL=1